MDVRNRILRLDHYRPADLLDHPLQWRLHPPEQLQALRGVLSEVGIVDTLLAYHSERAGGALVKIDGHARASVLDTAWPTLILDLTDAEADYILATHDPLSAMADVDQTLLAALVADLAPADAAVEAMLGALLAGVAVDVTPGAGGDEYPTDPDPEQTRVQPGDVWRCGAHLVCCLDSTDRAAVERVMGGQVATFVWADPPYGVKAVGKDGRIGSDYSQNNTPGYERFNGYSANVYPSVIGDETTDTAKAAAGLYLALYPKARHVWWGGNHYADALPPSSCWLVWDKQTDGDDFPDAELAWCNDRGAVRMFRHLWKGMLRATEVNEKRLHPTQKPVALPEWTFGKYGTPGDVIVDPFLGSGISLIAAERLADGRRVVGFELSAAYCAVSIARWEAETGRVAVRA